MSDSSRFKQDQADLLEEVRRLLAERKYAEAEAAATAALGGSADEVETARLSLARAEAILAQGRAQEAEADLLKAAKHATNLGGDHEFLLQGLVSLRRFGEAAKAAGDLLAQSPGDRALLYATARALRQAGRQDEAWALLRDVVVSAETPELLTLKASLLCDTGDFVGAVELLTPVTTPIESAPHALLSLRGWADQNTPGDEAARDGERVYREASRQEPADLWYLKGLGNALLRLGRRSEAEEAYRAVIRRAEELKTTGALDAYTTCLTGWCYYCLGDAKQGARFYSAGLAAKSIGPAARFDYALILLVDGRRKSAAAEYAGAIAEIRSKNILRRCGLLYIALFDLRNAIAKTPGIAAHAETAAIRKALREALRESVKPIRQDWPHLAERIGKYVHEDEEESHEEVSTGSDSWSELHIVGFVAPGAGSNCAVLLPVLSSEARPDFFQEMRETGPALSAPIDADTLNRQAAEGRLVLLAGAYPASAASRVLWIGSGFAKAVGQGLCDPGGERLAWQELAVPRPSFAAVTSRQTAARVLGAAAGVSIESAATKLLDGLRTESEERLAECAESARYALEAAQTEVTAYQAALLLTAAGGAQSEEELRRVRPDLPETVSHDGGGLWARAKEFAGMARLRAGAATSSDDAPGPEIPWVLRWENPLARRILGRAYQTAQVSSRAEQDRLAALAAAEIQLLIPLTNVYKLAHQHLTEGLKYYMVFYLETDDAVMVIGREPAFYTSCVLRPLSRPAVDSFAFGAAAERFRSANSALGLEVLAQWAAVGA